MADNDSKKDPIEMKTVLEALLGSSKPRTDSLDMSMADFKSMKRINSVIDDLSKSLNGLTGISTNTEASIKNMGDSVTSGVKSLGNGFHKAGDDMLKTGNIVGGIFLKSIGEATSALGAMSTAILDESQKQAKTWHEFAEYGATSTKGLKDISDQYPRTLLSLEKFQSTITGNANALAMYGGRISEGAKTFSESQTILANTSTELRNLGFSVESMADATASYMSIQAKSARQEKLRGVDLANATEGYVKQLDLMSRLTGANNKELQKRQDDLLRESRYGAAIRNLERKGVNTQGTQSFLSAIDTMAPELSKGIRDTLGGNYGTEQGKQAANALASTGGLEPILKMMREGASADELMIQLQKQNTEETRKSVDRLQGIGGSTALNETVGYELQRISKVGSVEEALKEQAKAKAQEDKRTQSQVEMEKNVQQAAASKIEAETAFARHITGAADILSAGANLFWDATKFLAEFVGDESGKGDEVKTKIAAEEKRRLDVSDEAVKQQKKSRTLSDLVGEEEASIIERKKNRTLDDLTGGQQTTAKTNVSGPITINGKTFKPGDKGYDDAKKEIEWEWQQADKEWAESEAKLNKKSGTYIAGQIVTPEKGLTPEQIAAMDMSMSMGNKYSSDIMDAYGKGKGANGTSDISGPQTIGSTTSLPQNDIEKIPPTIDIDTKGLSSAVKQFKEGVDSYAKSTQRFQESSDENEKSVNGQTRNGTPYGPITYQGKVINPGEPKYDQATEALKLSKGVPNTPQSRLNGAFSNLDQIQTPITYSELGGPTQTIQAPGIKPMGRPWAQGSDKPSSEELNTTSILTELPQINNEILKTLNLYLPPIPTINTSVKTTNLILNNMYEWMIRFQREFRIANNLNDQGEKKNILQSMWDNTFGTSSDSGGGSSGGGGVVDTVKKFFGFGGDEGPQTVEQPSAGGSGPVPQTVQQPSAGGSGPVPQTVQQPSAGGGAASPLTPGSDGARTTGKSSDKNLAALMGDKEFVANLKKFSSERGIDPNNVLAMMKYESAGYKTGVVNSLGYKGLFQAGKQLWQGSLGKKLSGAGFKYENFEKESASRQLQAYQIYYDHWQKVHKGKPIDSLGDLAALQLAPGTLGNASGAMYQRGSKAYAANAPLDINKDGIINREEYGQKMRERYGNDAKMVNAALGESNPEQAATRSLQKAGLQEPHASQGPQTTVPTDKGQMAAAIAKAHEGQGEAKAGRSKAELNPWLNKYAGDKSDVDVVAWCARFVSASLEQAGIKSTKNASAGSYKNWGQGVDPKDAKAGDVVLIPAKTASGYHVMMSQGIDPATGKLKIVGGNQGKGEVSERSYDLNKKGMIVRRANELIGQQGPQTVANLNNPEEAGKKTATQAEQTVRQEVSQPSMPQTVGDSLMPTSFGMSEPNIQTPIFNQGIGNDAAMVNQTYATPSMDNTTSMTDWGSILGGVFGSVTGNGPYRTRTPGRGSIGYGLGGLGEVLGGTIGSMKGLGGFGPVLGSVVTGMGRGLGGMVGRSVTGTGFQTVQNNSLGLPTGIGGPATNGPDVLTGLGGMAGNMIGGTINGAAQGVGGLFTGLSSMMGMGSSNLTAPESTKAPLEATPPQPKPAEEPTGAMSPSDGNTNNEMLVSLMNTQIDQLSSLNSMTRKLNSTAEQILKSQK